MRELDSLGREIVSAIYGYESRSTKDFSFQANDLMLLLDDSDDQLWYVRHCRTNKKGYIPRVYLAKLRTLKGDDWYAFGRTNGRVEQLVVDSNLPSFLIQALLDDDRTFAFTIRNTGENLRQSGPVRHYKIYRLSDGRGWAITQNRIFNTLGELMQYYTKRNEGFHCLLTSVDRALVPSSSQYAPLMSPASPMPQLYSMKPDLSTDL